MQAVVVRAKISSGRKRLGKGFELRVKSGICPDNKIKEKRALLDSSDG